MTKTRLEKVSGIDEQIAKLKNQRKLEMQKHNAEERKIRDRRLYRRAGLFESLLPETINLTDEQFNTFLRRTVANNFGRDRLAQIIAEGETTDAPAPAETQKPINVGSSTENPQSTTTSGA